MTTSIVNGGAVIDGAGGGGASLPATPAAALLDAGNPLKLVSLDAGGIGDAIAFEDASETGLTDLISTLAGGTATAGSYLSADGAGGLQLTAAPTAGLDTARPAAAVAILGALYTATDTGVRYVCESDGAGGARWVVQGALGQEGRDTTAVQSAATVYGTSSNTVNTANIGAWAIVFSQRSIPVATQVLATIDTGAGAGIQLADIGRQSGDRYLLSVFRVGSWTGGQALTGATISASPTTVHCLACRIDGQFTRYSLDGATVAVVDHGSGSATNGTAALRLCANSAGSQNADSWMIEVVVWSTEISNAALEAVSDAAAAGGASPGRIPAVSGATELARYHAATERTGVAVSAAIGTLGGTMTWSAAPTLVIK